MKKTTADRILSVLKGRKRGLSAQQIAEKLSCSENTVRTTLWALRKDGKVQVASTLPATGGRPAYLYTA